MKQTPHKNAVLAKFKRGDVCRVVVGGRSVLASIVATLDGKKRVDGETRDRAGKFRLLTEEGKTIERAVIGMRPAQPGDREKLSVILAKFLRG